MNSLGNNSGIPPTRVVTTCNLLICLLNVLKLFYLKMLYPQDAASTILIPKASVSEGFKNI